MVGLKILTAISLQHLVVKVLKEDAMTLDDDVIPSVETVAQYKEYWVSADKELISSDKFLLILEIMRFCNVISGIEGMTIMTPGYTAHIAEPSSLSCNATDAAFIPT
jgi:hypothetical protein